MNKRDRSREIVNAFINIIIAVAGVAFFIFMALLFS